MTSLDIGDRMATHVGDGGPLGAVWCLDREGEATVGWAGSMDIGGRRSVERDTIFRISSMTKPIAGVAALTLVAEGSIGLDDAVERWLPELAHPTVMRDPDGSLEDIVPG